MNKNRCLKKIHSIERVKYFVNKKYVQPLEWRKKDHILYELRYKHMNFQQLKSSEFITSFHKFIKTSIYGRLLFVERYWKIIGVAPQLLEITPNLKICI